MNHTDVLYLIPRAMQSDAFLSRLMISSAVFNQRQRVPSPLLNLELAIGLADDPAVIELATGTESVKQRQEVPL